MKDSVLWPILAQAREYATEGSAFDVDKFHNKIVELTVRECANLHDMNSGYYDVNNEWCAYYEVILKHFGVEE